MRMAIRMIDEKWLKTLSYGIPSAVLATWAVKSYMGGDRGPVSSDTISGWLDGNTPWAIQSALVFGYLVAVKRRVDRG